MKKRIVPLILALTAMLAAAAILHGCGSDSTGKTTIFYGAGS